MAPKIENLVNQSFGDLIVLERANNRNGRAYWVCQCSCGKILEVAGVRLRAGQRSCGCKNKKDITNQRFNRLIAIRQIDKKSPNNGSFFWECLCDCGKTVFVRRDQLISGRTKSCGCLKKEQDLINLQQQKRNLINQRFGKLVVIDIDKQSSNLKYYWKCKCDCGTVKTIREDHLIEQSVSSCGCQKQSSGEVIIEKILKENNISYQREFSFQDLKDKKLLRFDFALFDKENNLLGLIEFDGLQHIKETNGYFGESLKEIQKRDKLKNNYCKKNKILLFRIPYTSLKKIHSIYDILNVENLQKE